MNKSLQAMFLFNIESASYIDKDPSWNYFMLYEVVKKFKNNPTSYRLMGYSTTYETMKGKRAYNRISQFLILPCYQKKSFGKSLVQSVYDYYMKVKNWEEINVEKPTNAFKRLRDSIEYNLVVQSGYFKSIDNIIFDQHEGPDQELYDVVVEIHEKLKISNSRIIKILQNHYLSKKELVYKQSNGHKNIYAEFKQVIGAVQKMFSSQKQGRYAIQDNPKVSPKNLRKQSAGRMGTKNPRKRQRKQSKLESKAKLLHNSDKSMVTFNANITTFSSSCMMESAKSDSDSDWQSPLEDTKSNYSSSWDKNKLRSHQLESRTDEEEKTNWTTRTSKRKKTREEFPSANMKRTKSKPAKKYKKMEKVVVTQANI